MTDNLTNFKYSRHSNLRLQQRSIRRYRFQLLLIFGELRRARGGAYRVQLTKQDCVEMQEYLGGSRAIDRRDRRLYAIVSDDAVVVTVAYAYARRRRPRWR